MKKLLSILLLGNFLLVLNTKSISQTLKNIHFEFYGDTVVLPFDSSVFVDFKDSLSNQSIEGFYEKMEIGNFEPIINSLLQYKILHQPDDWLYYQLIRKTAQSVSPKANNYLRYTLYKWFFLSKSGYDATLSIAGDSILLYVRCDEPIYNIPYHMCNGKQYVCLNYHDYSANIDFEKQRFFSVPVTVPEASKAFSYKVTRLPDFNSKDYIEKNIQFTYYQSEYHFKVKINPDVKTIFANYPVVDYSTYFNIPMSKETESSLIPLLKKDLKGMNTKSGVDYLMHFTREAFMFKSDRENFGAEKRLTAEQTLLYDQSDCEDRAALFFFLVKKIYDLPMIVMVFPEHVTVAVKFDKPIGKPIIYNGEKYSVCEPTPQRQNLKIGELLPALTKEPYEIACIYNPKEK